MDDPQRRRSGGRAARQALRLAAHAEHVPFLTRKLAPFEVLGEEGLALIEHNADTILEEVGVEFRGDAEALRLLARRRRGRRRRPRPVPARDVPGDRPGDGAAAVHPVRAEPRAQRRDRRDAHGLRPELRLAVRARPRQRPPLRHDRGLPEPREARPTCRPYMHHSGGTVCEPVDVPVNKRHLDMVYSHIRYSDKPFMGSVTAPERARDTVEMARLTFGAEYLEDHTVITSLINANSPLVWDSVMLGAARAYAEANQATLLTPFILAGAMAPVTAAGVCAQTLAEALAGMTFVQLTRPGAPVILGSFASSMSMQSGAPTFGTPGAGARPVRDGRARPPPRRPVPLRRLAVRLEDRRRPGRLRVGGDAPADRPRRRQLRAPRGGLARGRADRRVREVHPRRGPVRDDGRLRRGRRHVRERPGARRDPGQRAGHPLPRQRPHAGQLRDRLLPLGRRRTTTASSSGRRTARSTRRSGPMPSGRRCWPGTRPRRSIPAWTRRCRTSSRAARRRCPIPRSSSSCSSAAARR